MAIEGTTSEVSPRQSTVERAVDRLPDGLARQGRYRRTLTVLVRAGGEARVGTVVRRLAEAEPGDDVRQRRSLYLWLHRTAVPTLCTLDIAEYDGDSGRLALRLTGETR